MASLTKDFLNQGKEIFTKYNNPNIKVITITSHQTKCVACTFGRTVKGYQIQYEKLENGLTLIMSFTFAINLDIKENRLIDFGFCNAFLNQN